MLIHELTTNKKLNEGIGDFFGLNNATVAKVWNELGSEAVHNLAVRFTRDPKYTNIKDLAQRKRAIERDEYLQQITQQYFESWNKQLNELEIRNGAPLTDQQYQLALLNWVNKVWYKNKFNSLDAEMQNRAKAHFAEITKNRNNAEKIKELFNSLAADQAAREVEVWTTMQQQQQPRAGQTQPTAPAPAGGAPKSGLPDAAEMAKFDQLVAQAAKAQS